MTSSSSLLSKLEAAELRIGLAEEKDLSSLLDPALPNLLSLLCQPGAEVRDKLMGILSHLNKRIKGNPDILLPLEALAALFLKEGTPPTVANFSLLYLEMGLPRVGGRERGRLVARLLCGVAGRALPQQAALFSLLLGALGELELPERTDDVDRALPFMAHAADRALVLEYLLDLLQYLPPLASGEASAPPGLSVAAAKRVCGKLDPAEVRGELLAAKKLAACRLLAAPASREHPREAGALFTPAETLAHWLVASCDGEPAVQAAGEAELRKLSHGLDLEQSPLIDALCRLVVGAPASSSGTPAADARRAAAVAVRAKAVGYLSRSVAAASHFPGALQATFHAIFAPDASPKLQQAGCGLAEWLVNHAQPALLAVAGAHLLSGLLKVLRGEAHPGLRAEAAEAVAMRSHAYGALAAMARRAPELVRTEEGLPAELFGALQTEDAGARTALHEALAALADVHAPGRAGRPLPPRVGARLRALLANSAIAPAPQARLAAMTWAGRVFARSDVSTRLVCLAGAADTRSEVREAALAALRPPGGMQEWRHTAVPAAPAAAAFVAGARVTVADRAGGRRRLGVITAVHTDSGAEPYYTVHVEGGSERSTEASHLTLLPEGWPPFAQLAPAVLARTELGALGADVDGVWEAAATAAAAEGPPLPARASAEALRYLVDCLAQEARALEPAVSVDVAAGARLAQLLCDAEVSGNGGGGPELLALLGRCLFAPHDSRELLAAGAATLHKLLLGAVRTPAGDGAAYALARGVARAEAPLLRLALGSTTSDEAAQRTLCESLALAAARGAAPAAAVTLLRTALANLPDITAGCAGPSESRRAVGAALLAGFLCAELTAGGGMGGDAMLTNATEAEAASVSAEAAARLAELVEHRSPLVACAATSAIGVVGAAAPLPLPEGMPAHEGEHAPSGASSDAPMPAPAPAAITKCSVVSTLCSLLKRDKIREAAVVSLGQIVSGDPHAAFRNDALESLFGLGATKDIDLHLSVGEALSRLADADAGVPAGGTPAHPLPPIKVPERPAIPSDLVTLAERKAAAAAAAELPTNGRLIGYVLGRVLLQHAVAWPPLERQAAAAWLVAILRNAAGRPNAEQIRASAPAIQTALVGLLADAQEATQELASKGLSALFDCCDELTRKAILNQLVAGLHSSRSANASASGGEMATYKELSEIAAGVGQPQLVYKLMECAASSAVWNTRKGVAFALAEQSREALEEHLPALLPSLYRHTHDPNPRVAGAMRQLWSALVPEPKATLARYLQPVLEHLCASLGDRLWRAREGACLALAELLPGRTHDELVPRLAELHAKLMRALDDIKESVRTAAEAAWRALCSACVRLSDGSKASEAEAATVLDVALPALLDGGVLNSSSEVRAACTKQLLKLAQGAGAHLAPHTPRLVPFLVDSLSSLEDPTLMYMQHHAPGLGVSAGAFEQARVAATRLSPAAAALEQALAVMRDEDVDAVLPPLTEALSRGTGLPARAGAARTLMQLAQRRPTAVAPHAGRILATLAAAIPEERSVAARRAYTSAAAQVARLTKPEPLGEMLRKMAERYATGAITTNEEGERLVLATLVRELGRGAPDAMAGLRADWLPLAFVGRHEPLWEAEVAEAAARDEAGKLASVWEEAYDEGGGGPGAVAAHLSEVLDLLGKLVEGQSWALRRAAAAALVELATLSSGALTRRADAAPQMEALAARLREPSRRWVDKEALMSKLDAAIPPKAPPAAAEPPTSGDF